MNLIIARFSAFISMLKIIAFDDLSLNRLFVETYAHRKHHLAILEENDFVFEGKLRQHVKIGGQYVDSILHGLLHC